MRFHESALCSILLGLFFFSSSFRRAFKIYKVHENEESQRKNKVFQETENEEKKSHETFSFVSDIIRAKQIEKRRKKKNQ